MPADALTPHPEVLFQELAEQAVLLDLRTDRYYQLDAVGAQVWLGLQQGLTVPKIAGEVARELTVPVERAEADVRAFLQGLQVGGLVSDGAERAAGPEAG